jgi:hypothetical protein
MLEVRRYAGQTYEFLIAYSYLKSDTLPRGYDA